MSFPAALAIAVVLLAINGLFVATEFALLASRRSRIEHLAADGDRGARATKRVLARLPLALAGAQLGITMASLGLGAVAEPAAARVVEKVASATGLPEGVTAVLGVAFGLGAVVLAHMVIGEMAPKSLALANPERTASRLARPFRAFISVTRPALVLLRWMGRVAVRVVGVQPQDERALAHSASDLALLLRESVEEGTLESDEGALLQRALGLSGLCADEAMTPREELHAVPASASVDDIEATARRGQHARLLVYELELNHVVGVVHVRDVLALDRSDRATRRAGDLARPVLVVVDHRPLGDVLLDMRSEHKRFAVVVDELGAVAGVVTMQGVLETLLGRAGEAA